MRQNRDLLRPDLQSLTKRLRWVTHPITLFVCLQMVWVAITLIWVIWFVGQQEAISDMARRFGQEYFSRGVTVAVLVVGCVLLGVLLLGTIMLFVFGQRQSYLARQHRNFVSSVTHELKSPLASLQLSFETMHEHQLDAATSERLSAMIVTDIERLRRLVDQVLVAGRLDRGILAFDDGPRHQVLLELVESIAGQLRFLDPALSARLHIDCPPALSLKVPRSALTLIINNLLENAIKYSPPRTPIEVRVREVDSEGGRVEISVRDQGLGLDKSDKRRMFRMFHRSEVAVRKAIPGTGLGLYIVKSAIRVLRGRVWVESPGRNQGSTFYISLPRGGV